MAISYLIVCSVGEGVAAIKGEVDGLLDRHVAWFGAQAISDFTKVAITKLDGQTSCVLLHKFELPIAEGNGARHYKVPPLRRREALASAFSRSSRALACWA